MQKKENRTDSQRLRRCCLLVVFLLLGSGFSFAQEANAPVAEEDSESRARVTGLRNISIHVLQLEKTLKLY
ncbi:MAG: VOC family protein, partial [Bacteroidota bacterium]